MSLDSTEEEQIERIKQFFRENGLFFVLALVLVVGGNVGFNLWETSQQEAAEAASADFARFQEAVEELVATDSGREDAIALGQVVKRDHEGTAYAALSALQLARLYFDDKNYEKAEAELRLAADAGPDLIAPLAKIRLAKVIYAQGDYERALVALGDEIGLGGYASSWHETRGDILYELGRLDEARQAYQFAVTTGGEDVLQSLTMKLEDLTVSASAVALSEEGSADASEVEVKDSAAADATEAGAK